MHYIYIYTMHYCVLCNGIDIYIHIYIYIYIHIVLCIRIIVYYVMVLIVQYCVSAKQLSSTM